MMNIKNYYIRSYKSISNMVKLKTLTLAIVLFPSLLAGCGLSETTMNTSTIFAMDTIMELEVSGHKEVMSSAEEMIRTLEKELSVTDENSEISALNRDGEAVLTSDVSDIMEGALSICNRTEGALDISIYPVLKSWGFTTGEYRVPSDEEIESHLDYVDYGRISFDKESNRVTIDDGMQVDLGSVAKGYTSTAVCNYLKEQGVTSALINLGGNVQCVGSKPNGDDWKVAVKSPFEDSASGMFGVLEVSDMAVITSGGYERYFEEDGETYWHILDPKTGKPVKNGIVSVTIIGEDGLVCDGLSTALFVKGLDEAVDFYKASDDFEAVFITEDGQAYVTEGVADDFTLTSEYYDAPVHVISR